MDDFILFLVQLQIIESATTKLYLLLGYENGESIYSLLLMKNAATELNP